MNKEYMTTKNSLGLGEGKNACVKKKEKRKKKTDRTALVCMEMQGSKSKVF